MKLFCILLTLSFSIAEANATESYTPDSWGKAYARRDFKLGMTLDKFRATPFPDKVVNMEGKEVEAIHVCSRDELATTSPNFYRLKEAEASATGVTICQHYFRGSLGSPDDVHLGMGKTAFPTQFYFIKPQGAPSAYLFKIEGRFDSGYYGDLRQGLASKLGKPRISSAVVQNGFGALFRDETATWSNEVSTITMALYNADLTQSKITYTLNPLNKIFLQRQAVTHSEQSDPY